MKLYFDAEKYISSSDKGSVQSRIFGDSRLANPKHVFALVISTLKFKDYIVQIIKTSKIKDAPNIKKLRVSNELLMLLTHDLLFSTKGRIQSGRHPIKDAFLLNKTRLHSELIKLKLKYKAINVGDLPNVYSTDDETPIRWFRINTLKTTTKVFFETHAFFKQLRPVDQTQEIQLGTIYRDAYIPYLYGVDPKEKIMTTEAYKAGQIIIQDRASCFPAHILFDDPHFQPTSVIDACAAPGNKTTHIASYLNKSDSVVYAFERDPKRVQILKKMCKTATNKSTIQITHLDFLNTDPNDFANVTGLVVDPSCSGSGIFGRALEDSLEQANEELSSERLLKLSKFQFKIMKHALMFPHAQKVVYSTCSIHPQENERVVVDLLMDQDIAKVWELAPRSMVISNWHRRGWEQEFTALATDKTALELAGGCVRALPQEDGGIGFFAACFIRKPQLS